MVDLSTSWLGLRVPSPLVVGASPVADDVEALPGYVDAGAGAVVVRSVFEEQIVAEQLAAHRLIDSYVDTDAEARSFLPESEVFSLGPEPALAHLAAVRAAVDVPVLGSLNGVTPGGWTDIARQMADAGADAIELNLYDVVTATDESSAEVEGRQITVVEEVVAAVDVPVAVKLSPFYTALPAFVVRLAAAGAAGVTVFNRFYQPGIDLDTLDVDRHLTLSSPDELPLRLHALALLHGRVDLSLGSTGGVHRGHDAAKAILCGASAVQVASALLVGGAPGLASIRDELVAWLDEGGYRTVDEARGATAFDNVADPHAFERVNYTRLLQGWRPRRDPDALD
ncbi:dihydroorotate dehydrogenase-like protein [Rhabdothermincola salaria]|uniref:dihydroorotate dehydrogenase-like protein n=1 Tax=Rhabdothermincola salaria TaxID=2903142 RepID=UPI001E2E2477|nr:dihydroorotate dehydrogenase-like protein [Rhabdothermincola salaria]MCD9622895.1 dihydroorotate dehydrogenase-like protein [Rhabdothermincola salaria]